MDIKQFEDKYLSHYSYAILSNNEIVLIDPARNPKPYYDYAKEHNAKIIGVIETHPHADFISSHLEIHQTTGAIVYAHSLAGVNYPSQTFNEGDCISFGNIQLKSLHTPGHSPDSISILMEYKGEDKAVFTGDTLFIGDCGRPDLRECAGNLTAKREELAKQMYHSLRNKLAFLNDNILVYPAHGAGTLCGKALSEANSSTIGLEKLSNWSLQEMNEEEFVVTLIEDQPFIPKYFGYDVELNRKGANTFQPAIDHIKIMDGVSSHTLNPEIIVVDTRSQELFKKGHLSNSFNIQAGNKFETWLGSIINPGEKFYLLSNKIQILNHLIHRTASIGYEEFIEGGVIIHSGDLFTDPLNLDIFSKNKNQYTIVDIRNLSEVKSKKIFPDAINIPLGELREKVKNIPTDKPIVVHCAAGYRSAAGSSIIKQALGKEHLVYDLGENIKNFQLEVN